MARESAPLTSRLAPETVCPAPSSTTAVVRVAPGRNTTSDATLLPAVLAAAAGPIEPPDDAEMRADLAREAMEPLFELGGSDEIGMAQF